MRLLFLLLGGAITATGLAGLAMLPVIPESTATRVQDVRVQDGIASCVPTLPEEEEEEEEETPTETQRRT